MMPPAGVRFHSASTASAVWAIGCAAFPMAMTHTRRPRSWTGTRSRAARSDAPGATACTAAQYSAVSALFASRGTSAAGGRSIGVFTSSMIAHSGAARECAHASSVRDPSSLLIQRED